MCASSRRHAYEQEIHKSHGNELKILKSAYELKDCKTRKRDAAFVKSVVEDPVDADRVVVETGAEPIPIPCELSESEKMKHELTHIPFKPWSHHASKAHHNLNPTNAPSAPSKTAKFQLFSVTTLF